MAILAMRDRNMFIGVGQCGGNIAKEFERVGYQSFYVNSNLTDLKTLGVPTERTFHIPLAEGCNKDAQKAKDYGKLYYDQITEIIGTKYSQFKNKFFCFSLGGGTGSGFSPILIHAVAVANPHVNVGAIIALPSSRDSLKAKENALRCITSLSTLLDAKTLKNVYVLDNNSGDIFEINSDITERLTRLFNVTKANTRGIVDTSEIEDLLSISGCVNIFDILETAEGVEITQDKHIIKSAKGCVKSLYSLRDESHLVKDEIEEITGNPKDYFKGYCEEDENSVAFAFGMQLPKARLAHLEREYKEELDASRTESRFGMAFNLESPVVAEPDAPQIHNEDIMSSLFD